MDVVVVPEMNMGPMCGRAACCWSVAPTPRIVICCCRALPPPPPMTSMAAALAFALLMTAADDEQLLPLTRLMAEGAEET